MFYSSIGKPIIRKDGIEKINGSIKYVNDYTYSGVLYAAIKTSVLSHGKIKSIDTRKASQLSGVRAILTGEDYPILQGCYLKDKPPLAVDKVRYYGEPVAAVVADTFEEAAAAAEEIKIEYEPLPLVKNARDASNKGAPLLHENLGKYSYKDTIQPEKNSNIANHTKIRKGNIVSGFENSDVIIEASLSIPSGDHAAMEPRTTIAEIRSDGQVVIHTSTQTPFLVRKLLSTYFKIPVKRITIIAPPLGGGFGGKAGIQLEALAYLLSRAVGGRPVKIANTREADLLMSAGRNGMEATIRLGSTQEGRLQAAELMYYFDCGAYADYVVKISRAAAIACTGPYHIPNVWCDSLCVYTNKPYGTAYRGYGHTELTFAVERGMDILAKKLGMDPLRLRLINAIEAGDTTPCLNTMEDNDGNLRRCLERAADLINWQDGGVKWVDDYTIRASGISALWKATIISLNTGDNALVSVDEDGSVNLHCGVMELGQGTKTALAQIAAEVLRISTDNVKVFMPVNTDTSPYDWATVGSRSLFMAGKAVIEAAEDALNQLLDRASNLFKLPKEALDYGGGRVFVKAKPDIYIDFIKLAGGEGLEGNIISRNQIIGRGNYKMQHKYEIDPETGEGRATIWTLGAEAVEVEVNIEDFSFKVLRAACVMDVGKVINPELARGQVVGSMAMALGMATTESFNFNKGLQVLNGSLRSYKVLRLGEEPEYLVEFIETPQVDGPYGARGLGEQAAIGIPAAVANALSTALGTELNRLPLVPEALWRSKYPMEEANAIGITEGIALKLK